MSNGEANSNSNAASNGFLDITNIGNDQLDQLANAIESFYKVDGTVKTRLTYHWDRNHRFLDGDQWLVFDGDQATGGVWRKLTVNKANEYIPRPVTNLIFDAYQTLKSYLIKTKPRSRVIPNTQTFKDKSAAKIAELCLEANWERLLEQQNYEYAAACVITYGTVFKKDYWDNSSVTIVKIPRMVMQPKIDPMTGALIGEDEIQEVDPETGDPVFDELPLGDVNTSVVEPYRIALDPLATDLHTARWIIEYSIQPIDWIKETYGQQEEGYTGRAEEVKPEPNLSGSMRRFVQLKNSSGMRNNSVLESGPGTAGEYSVQNAAVVKEYYERPSAKHPKGRMVVVANGITLYAGASPCEGPEMGDWHPYSECRWEVVPGRFWGKSPLDPATEIQKRLNSIDATIILTRKTMAIPQKLIPVNAGVPNGTWTGRPGQEVYYRDSGGAKPEIFPATGVDSTVFTEREQCKEDIKAVTGAIDILKGDRPPGVTAASALNLLYEVGTGKLFPVLDRWKRFVETSQKKQLKLISRKYREPRPDYIRMLKIKNTELSEEAINKFIGMDLYDNCNVIVEAGSNIPKLLAARQAALQEAAQAGTLNLELPSNRMEYNRQMGIEGFDNDVGPDVKRAEWENDLLDNIAISPDNRPIVLFVDNHEIHQEVLANRMKEPAFMDLSPEVQKAYMQHYEEHEKYIQQAKEAEQMEAMLTGQPPQPDEGGNAPQDLSGRGKGVPTKVSTAMKQDMMPPGQVE